MKYTSSPRGRLRPALTALSRRFSLARRFVLSGGSARSAFGVAMSFALLAQGLVFGASAPPAARTLPTASALRVQEGQGGTRVKLAAATVDVQEVAEQEALAPASAPAAPRAIHPPLTDSFEGEPPPGWVAPSQQESSSGSPVLSGGEGQGALSAPSLGAEEDAQPNVPSPTPVSAGFQGLVDNQQVIPPDTMGAVGPTHIVTPLNDRTRIHLRDGTPISTFSTDSFWDPLEAVMGYTLNVFDPKIHYDRSSGRWIYTITANAQSSNSATLLAVSKTSDPTGAWNLYGVDAEGTGVGVGSNWADYPSIGFNATWIVVQVNIFSNSTNTFQRPEIYVFDKADAIANSPTIDMTEFVGVNTGAPGDITGGTWAPSIDLDNSSPGKMWFVQNWNSTSGLIRVSTLTGTANAPVVNSGTQFPQSPESWFGGQVLLNGGWAPQANDTKTAPHGTYIAANDARMQNVVYRNGTLWATHTVFEPTVHQPAGTNPNSIANPVDHSAIQWWQIDPALEPGAFTTAPLQRSIIEDLTADNCHNGAGGLRSPCTPTGSFYAFPFISVNNINDVLIGFTHFSPTRWATAAYAYRDHSDAPNTFREVVNFKETTLAEGSGRYSKSGNGTVRWGDYSAAMTDPLNDRNFWTTQEYAAPRINGGATSVWATWYAQVNALNQTADPGQFIISEFRLQGPNGASDEYIEIYNRSETPHTVQAIDDVAGGTGYALVASDGVTRCVIPNGTVIPGKGHYLCINSVGYSQANYPAGNGTTATGDATYTLDIPLNAGIALFRATTTASLNAFNRLDAVGSVSEINVLYKEGTGYPDISNDNVDYAIVRDLATGNPKDTNNNEADFDIVDPNGTNMCTSTVNFRCQRLGAPGPENLSSPIQRFGPIHGVPLDPCVSQSSPPNRVRTLCPSGSAAACASQNASLGTLSIRRQFVNLTGAPVTRLRFRITDITTFPVPVGTADLRYITSANAVTPDAPFNVTVDRPPCGTGTQSVTVYPTTLETGGLGQPNGGGFNSTGSAGTITLANPLPAGMTIDVQFLLGVQQSGSFRFFVTVEALP